MSGTNWYMKNSSLYAGVGDSVFSEPSEVVPQDYANELINITTERLKYIQAVERASLGKIATSETGAKMRRFSKEYNKLRKTDA